MDQQTSGRMENQLLPRASQGTKLQDRLKLEKSKLSYADLHSKVIENADNISSTSGNHQKLRVERKATENEELVKYMSNLPSYLEREENLWKKAFNVGVLDWRRLEKWQYNHKGISNRSGRYSLSSSNSSSFFSTDGSSMHSSRGPSCSPARQRIHRPTLQSLLIASPKEGYSQGVKSFGGNVGNSQDLKAASSEPLKEKQKMLRTYQSFEKEIKTKECKRRDSYPHIVPDIKVHRGFENYVGESRSKGKMKIQECGSRKGVEKMQEPYHNIVDHDLTINYRSSSEANQRRFSDVLSSEEIYSAELYSGIPHSCPLPCEVEEIKCSHLNQSSSLDKMSIKFSSEPSKSLPSSAKISISPSRGKKASNVLKPCEGSDLKMGTAATKSRNSSPIRRFSIGMGRARSASSKDGQLSSQHATAKSGSEKSVTPDCLDNTSSDKPNSTSRARSSPLRRLLEPLLKPKRANSHHFAEPLRKDSASTYGACKSSDGRVESSIVHPVKVKLDFTSSRTSSANDSQQSERHGSSTVQALLKIAIKNGLPLFTFAVGKNRDILAATMKRIRPSEKDDDSSCIYTFFSICEFKNKNGRTNQRSKGKGPGYAPNVVAQMKVSSSQFSKLIRHNPVDQFSIREFVLFAVDLNHVNRHTDDLQPNDELAAIVVKFSKEPPSGLIQDGHQSDNFNRMSVTGLKEPLPEGTDYSNFRDNKENGSSVGNQDLFNMTVLLPGGAHGLPSKGEPSPLIERWISGGLCDCGGWDLGCRIRVFANQTQLRRSSANKAHPSGGRFELLAQGEVLDDRPLFSLSLSGDGVFSVEFNSSLSLLQAFSISIAVLNSRKPYELSESSNLFEEEKSSKETTLVEHEGIKAPNGIQVEVPARYASKPPLSPVGRV